MSASKRPLLPMTEVAPHLFVGAAHERTSPHDALCYVSRKEHLARLGRVPSKDDANYLVANYDQGRTKTINLIDVADPAFYELFGVIGLDRAMLWIDGWRYAQTVHIMCDQGRSRSASLAALYLSTRGLIGSSAKDATHDFAELYPSWCIGGMWMYILRNWNVFERSLA